ncbi:hypothetical protein BDN72DRAFT_898763 [Pluteus cervinus]|uniref:Uncharacterized protein n=1 Tax=Pluteus cervinus TaxID=181527 RepID=A0ACD3AQS8_9AGAR|nr:hypothetical protein BDN72DRAFT_898763 [Pluteus cervinus]
MSPNTPVPSASYTHRDLERESNPFSYNPSPYWVGGIHDATYGAAVASRSATTIFKSEEDFASSSSRVPADPQDVSGSRVDTRAHPAPSQSPVRSWKHLDPAKDIVNELPLNQIHNCPKANARTQAANQPPLATSAPAPEEQPQSSSTNGDVNYDDNCGLEYHDGNQIAYNDDSTGSVDSWPIPHGYSWGGVGIPKDTQPTASGNSPQSDYNSNRYVAMEGYNMCLAGYTTSPMIADMGAATGTSMVPRRAEATSRPLVNQPSPINHTNKSDNQGDSGLLNHKAGSSTSRALLQQRGTRAHQPKQSWRGRYQPYMPKPTVLVEPGRKRECAEHSDRLLPHTPLPSPSSPPSTEDDAVLQGIGILLSRTA